MESAEFAAMGAMTNAFTSYDMTAYYFSCTEHFEKCLRLLLEFVSTPYFTEESVRKEQGIIDQEIDMNLDAPDSVIFENLVTSLYETHPIRVPITRAPRSWGTAMAMSTPTTFRATGCHSSICQTIC